MSRRWPTRSILAALASSLLCTTTALGAATLTRPPAPSGEYRPTFVTETDEAVWTDCLWASATMFLDAWTRGSAIADREALRIASGDHVGGSNLLDLQRGFAAYAGIDLRWSPAGSDRMGWSDLLDRLAHGGAAVLLGWYALLPEQYTRWDPAFAAKGVGDSGHALFVTDYRPATDELWLMDPLGRGDYAGEWIAEPDLRRFAWVTPDGAIFAAATPRPEIDGLRAALRPFDGFGFAPPAIIDPLQTGATVELAIPVGDALGAVAARFPRVRIEVQFTALDDDVPKVETAGDVGEGTQRVDTAPDPDGGEPTWHGQLVDPTIQADGLRAFVDLPAAAGLYRLRVRLVDGTGATFPEIDRPHIPGLIVLVEDRPAPRSAPELIVPDIPLLRLVDPALEPPAVPMNLPIAPPRRTDPDASEAPTPTPSSPPSPSPSPTVAPLVGGGRPR